MKVVTSVVALDVLGPDYTVKTRVFVDPTDNTKIYLVGAGDVTLSRQPEGTTPYYAFGPRLDDLSTQIAAWASTNATDVSTIVLDSTAFGEVQEYWHPTWDRRGISQGYMGPISALQIDAARLTSSSKPLNFIGKRTDKPIQQAGTLFRTSLRKSGIATKASITRGQVPEGAIEIASVESRPMSEWIANTLRVSDNALSEALARLVSIELGMGGTAESLDAAYKQVLSARGIDISKVTIVDGSGLSRSNRMPAAAINRILAQVYADPEKHAAVRAGMPVSGKPGSLRFRFNAGEQRDALNLIEAKTGWIRTGYSLAGFIKAKDGTDLIFTVYNLGNSVNYKNRAAMDALVHGFFRCGASLSSN
jgi:D-alanyl-D-alanine carboxypeptidase/D-alanyl-D-alanine-endopeptidase (penicillin-binding protein 4)